MSDIVERLRTADIYDYADADKFCNEAADEIEKLRAALRFYAGDEPWKWTSEDYGKVAHAALGEKE
jgi:hypothetical protein